jgi:hypothetical protein
MRQRLLSGGHDGRDTYSLIDATVMERLRLSTNVMVFMLFFGVTTLEAFQTHNWVKAAFWLAIGIMFSVADNLNKVDKS